jgi:ribosomal protein L11 methyltransferase
MNYWEISLILKPREPWSEVLVAELSELGFDSFVETDFGVNGYIAEDVYDEEKVSHLIQRYENRDELELTFNKQFIPEENWNAAWERSFEPVRIGNELLIVAPFHKIENTAKHLIIIEPKMSFGTGHHHTTRLMAQSLLNFEALPSNILDMGCGTGILAILAEKLGAKHITAIDIEDWAYENAIENIERNGCSAIEVLKGDAHLLEGKTFDMILANINKNVLLNDMNVYASCLNVNGILILSGFFTSDNPILVDSAKKTNLALLKVISEENWSCLHFKKIDGWFSPL